MSRLDPQRLPDYLQHIVDAIARVQRYVGSLSEADFLQDEKTQDAVVRNFEVMGEAARHVQTMHEGFAIAHSDVPWALMYAMRNRVAHGYFQVDWHLIWMTIHNDLPALREQIERILGRLSSE